MFEIIRSEILDLVLVRPTIHQDYRGSFVELFNVEAFAEAAPGVTFVRDAVSTSSRHVLRGLHYDQKTWKLVQCLVGRLHFVVVDLREGSITKGRWEAFSLNDSSRLQVLVPPGCANGHLVMSDSCIFHYKLSAHYDQEGEKTLAYNDPAVGIHWPIDTPVLSPRDGQAAEKFRQ